MHVVMVAAENDRLPNCKVGGVADVIRDIPYALAARQIRCSVIVPDYGQFALNREFVADIAVPFKQHLETATLWRVSSDSGVEQYVVSHSLFSEHGGAIYCNDGNQPFATDANKFALFCAAVSELLEHQIIGPVDILHLHDWHAAVVAVLKTFSPRFVNLKQIKTVYTVHNLALQGIRPFKHDESSLESWFPTLSYDGSRICDHIYPHCFNPMRAAISLVDKVHLVSPTYCQEVQHSSDHESGFFGGEGLENDMQAADRAGRLAGILNGCIYPSHDEQKQDLTLSQYCDLAEQSLFVWMSNGGELKPAHYIAHQRVIQWRQHAAFRRPLVTSVGRLTDQKALLLRQPNDGQLILDSVATLINEYGGVLIILGSGDPHLEYLFTQVMARNDNVLYLQGYGQALGDHLYDLGDLFLMPSSFEPCGISQMLAMRAGQPCLAHQVGGLKDTIEHEHTGFLFGGSTLPEQAQQLLARLKQALDVHRNDPQRYLEIKANAGAQRFSWDNIASQYIEKLYE
ncbi:glycogen/starch synthase [Pseudoalteromonas sp. OOF1S-7]|uniref:glycogen synthase n=1 Tax=Pseudoalteromonas sp. OOF1S-7 TaxID=2917757 RepID=UPI001EF3F51F|nr:glycogen/starch synthase [Pseudoalteromonas sp. OOF1S-7]MCG7533984.1 glycogen/starch synthase [Pseudoalteromonas sp. OOF1S-7]